MRNLFLAAIPRPASGPGTQAVAQEVMERVAGRAMMRDKVMALEARLAKARESKPDDQGTRP